MLKQKLLNLKIKYKIFLIVISCIAVLLCSEFVSIALLSHTYQKICYQSISQSLLQSAISLSEQLKTVDSAADLLFSNRTIQTQLMNYRNTTSIAEKKLCRSKIYTAICDYIFNSGKNIISDISFYQNGELVSSSSSMNSILPTNVCDNLFKQAENADGATVWVSDYSQTYGLFLVKEINEIEKLSLDSLGVMIIKPNIEELINSTTIFNSSYEDATYLLFDGDIPIFYSPTLPSEDVRLLKEQLTSDYKVISSNSQSYFAVHGTLKEYGWEYISTVSYAPIAKTISTAVRLSFITIVFCILFAVISSGILISSITRHFDILVQKMKCFGNGQYKSDNACSDYTWRKDEIGLLHTSFDAMAHKVDTLIEENYTNELLKREAQIKSMESQMDPHFLYNTLDSINWRAKAIGASDISLITTALGTLLRSTLSQKSCVFTLCEELHILENYITIQKMRYQKRLECNIQIPEELLNCEIPRFTIQPLVENAIRYGLEEISETCFISVKAMEENGNILIEVKNTGSFFDENLLEKLLSQEIQPHGFGIGIINIHKRLQLTYGTEYGLKTHNIEDETSGEIYAVVRIIFPKHVLH